jgi:phage shock protein PspC (stress-responsive transcriptional regulator)
MQKVITINLNGNAYQLDEDGYEALRAYLAHAEAQLGSNPDKAEIIRDLEQSIAEKCMRHLGPGKSVVTTAEVEQMLREMGPVDGGPGGAHASHGGIPPQGGAPDTVPAVKRLYQIREGAMISGVCNGIAAYLNVDPTIVRIVFVVAFVTVALNSGDEALLIVLLYVVLMFLVPYAKTSEERAAAQGASASLPYKLQHAVEAVKAKFGGLHHRTP